MAGHKPGMGSVTNLDRGVMEQNSAIVGSTGAMDEALFRQLFNATYSRLVAYARRRSFDSAEADDVVAEVYAIAWRRRADIPTDTPALPWLYGIAANVLRNSRRAGTRRLQLVERLQTEPTATNPATSLDPADSAEETDRSDLRLALERLSWDDQEVLRLVTWEGLSHAEAGQALGCSTNAVGIRVHRARQRLETELNNVRNSDTPSERHGGAGQ